MLHALRSVVCFSSQISRKVAWEAARKAFYETITCLIVMCVFIMEGGAVPRPGERLGPRKQIFTTFGGWLDALCEILSMTQQQIAERVNVSEATISRITRGERTPSPGLVRDLWKVFQVLAEEKSVHLSYYTEIGFFNADGAGFATSSQSELSKSLLEMFRNEHGIGEKQEIEKLKAQLQQKEERIRELENERKDRS